MKQLQERGNVESKREIGKIISYNTERKFLIVESENGNTYLALLSEFSDYINLSEELIGRMVSFIRIEENGKRKAIRLYFI